MVSSDGRGRNHGVVFVQYRTGGRFRQRHEERMAFDRTVRLPRGVGLFVYLRMLAQADAFGMTIRQVRDAWDAEQMINRQDRGPYDDE